ncbi:MAG: hypothetical protein M3433_01495 [Actinomycetota bacterium]|nr:hypothetical protein [Actinomycetota bacterium]
MTEATVERRPARVRRTQMPPLADRAYLSLASAAFLLAQQPEAPGGRGDDPGKGGGIGVILGIAVAVVVVVALVFLVLRTRAGRRTNAPRSPKSPRGRTGV